MRSIWQISVRETRNAARNLKKPEKPTRNISASWKKRNASSVKKCLKPSASEWNEPAGKRN